MGNAIVISADGTATVRKLLDADALGWLIGNTGCCQPTPVTARLDMWPDELTCTGPNDVATALLHAHGRPHPGMFGTVILTTRRDGAVAPVSDRETQALLRIVDQVREGLCATEQVIAGMTGAES